MLPLARPRRLGGAIALVTVVAGCGGAAVAAAPARTATAKTVATVSSAPTATSARRVKAHRPSARIDRLTARAVRQYASEVSGPVPRALARRIAHDATLRRLLQSGDVTATRAYIARRFPAVWYHWHVSRMRILQGARVIDEIGVPFVVAPAQATLRGAGGKALGTLQVSIQDEIGFVRLMHRHNPIDVVVRGQRAGHVQASLPAAAHARLPAKGVVTIAGRRYVVRSFHEAAWANEPVTVWILARG